MKALLVKTFAAALALTAMAPASSLVVDVYAAAAEQPTG